MLYLQIASPKSSVLNFLDSNSFEVIISIFQRTEKVPDMERLLFSKSSVGKFCSIGYNVQIGVPEHPLNFFSTSPTIYRQSKLSKYCDWAQDDINIPVRIENDV